jgi:hypothetical protein
MNTASIDYQFILDSDSSPVIVFGYDGKIIWLNNSAEILLGYVDKKELFNLALKYAPKSFGSNTLLLNLHYKHLEFYAISVAYNNDEWVALRLYYRPRTTKDRKSIKKNLIPTDINILLEAAISLFKINYNKQLSLLVDKDMPKIKIDQNSFSKLLRKSLESFRNSSYIDISLKITIGEFMVLNEKKYPIARLKIEANGRYTDKDRDISYLSDSLDIMAILDENSITLDIPIIKA